MRTITVLQTRQEECLYPSELETGGEIHTAIHILAANHTAESEWLRKAAQKAFSRRYMVVKRFFDIAFALMLLVMFLPLGLVIAALVLIDSPGPVFYREERNGRFGEPFFIFKFRSMRCSGAGLEASRAITPIDNYAEDIRMHKRGRDPRVTRVGRYLRRLSLDELPQLINVVAGDMSLVGPRPIVTAERTFYGSDLLYYDILSPGITGLWQISGRSDVGYEKRVSLDKEYARQWSCLLDLAILVKTIPAVISMRGAY